MRGPAEIGLGWWARSLHPFPTACDVLSAVTHPHVRGWKLKPWSPPSLVSARGEESEEFSWAQDVICTWAWMSLLMSYWCKHPMQTSCLFQLRSMNAVWCSSTGKPQGAWLYLEISCSWSSNGSPTAKRLKDMKTKCCDYELVFSCLIQFMVNIIKSLCFAVIKESNGGERVLAICAAECFFFFSGEKLIAVLILDRVC